MTFDLTRNELHHIKTEDLCGDVSSEFISTTVIFFTVKFQLNVPLAEIAEYHNPNDAKIKLSIAPGNITAASTDFVVKCSSAGSLMKPWIYVLNYEGMLLIGVEGDEFVFKMIAHQQRPLDDQRVVFNITYHIASAVKVNGSTILMLVVAMIQLFG
jgi:hypothetical protein